MEESLFSLELHIETINRLKVPCAIPAVSFRLLDFPTLIVHHITPANVQKLREKSQIEGVTKESIQAEFRDRHGNIAFAKGKSCLFSADIVNLQNQLISTPLYVMVLDVWHRKPKLVGSTMIPLKKTIDKIANDVERLGVDVPSISQQEGTFDVYNLMGTVIGNIKLGLRMLSLGGALGPHIPRKSVMTRTSVKNTPQIEPEDKENDVIVDDLDVIAEETTYIHPTPMQQSTATQTSVPKTPKSVIYRSTSLIEDTDSEPVIITNTICPPPLYYHVMSDKENSRRKDDTKTSKAATSIQSEDVDFVYYKPDIVQPDGSCGCVSVSVQTNIPSNVQDMTKERPRASNEEAHVNQKIFNSDELPLLNALLEELSLLRAKRKEGTKVITPRKLTEEVSVPATRTPVIRECCSKVMAEKSTEKSKKTKPRSVVLAQKRVKFKQTNLKYGMTKTQLMRLELNKKTKQTTKQNELASQEPKHQEEKPSEPYSRIDLGKTHTLYPGSTEEEHITSTKNDKVPDDMTIKAEEKTEDSDVIRPDSVESSSRCLSSGNSVDIFLPQMEDDGGSDVFDVTTLDVEDRFAPHQTYSKHGHTGIPDIPIHHSPGPSDSPQKSLTDSEPSGNVHKELDMDHSGNQSGDQSETAKSSPVLPSSPRKTPDSTRRRSVTSQAKSRTSTALSMYSDDFEECPVWETPNASDDNSSSISDRSYQSSESQRSKRDDNNYQPTKSYYLPLKSSDIKKQSNHQNSDSDEESPSPNPQQSLDSTEQFLDSLNVQENDIEKPGYKHVLQLPKPANDMGYTF